MFCLCILFILPFPTFPCLLTLFSFILAIELEKIQTCIAGFKKCTANLDGLNRIIPQHIEEN